MNKEENLNVNLAELLEIKEKWLSTGESDYLHDSESCAKAQVKYQRGMGTVEKVYPDFSKSDNFVKLLWITSNYVGNFNPDNSVDNIKDWIESFLRNTAQALTCDYYGVLNSIKTEAQKVDWDYWY